MTGRPPNDDGDRRRISPSFERGRLLFNRQRYELALVEFQRALAEVPNDALVLAQMSIALSKLGRTKEAIAMAASAAGADPQQAIGHYALTVAHFPRGRKGRRYLRGLAVCRAFILEAIRLEPNNPAYLAILASMELDFGRPMQALEFANRGLAAQPNHIGCANLRAKAQAKLGLIVAASRTLETAIAADPENATTHATSAMLNFLVGRRERGMEHLTESARINPQNQRTIRTLERLRRGPSLLRRGLAITVAAAIMAIPITLIWIVVAKPRWLDHFTGASIFTNGAYWVIGLVVFRVAVLGLRGSAARRRQPTYDPGKLPPPIRPTPGAKRGRS